MTCAPCYSRHISRAYPSGCGRRFSRFPFPAHQDLLCRKGKSVYRSALRLSDKLHWPTVSAFCSTLAANRICRTTCNIGWQKQKVCCAFFSWMCRRASCTLSFPQTANSHSARPANTPFLDDKLKRLSDKIKQLKTAITQSSVNSQTPSTPTNPITAKDLLITEYDDMLTARIIEKIIVKSRQDLEIIFIGGYTQQISLQ